MNSGTQPTDAARQDPARFATTQWNLVLAAGDRSSTVAQAALSTLCEAYWHPLYIYARRRVRDVHTAQDLTQAFFTRIIEKQTLASAAPERGRFRSFLLTSFKNFLSNEWDKDTAAKRGGGAKTLSLDFAWAESRLSQEPAAAVTPEQEFDRQWALSLLDRVLDRLHDEYQLDGKVDQFEQLKVSLVGGEGELSQAELATTLGMTVSAVKSAAHRLRRRYQELLRAEITETVTGPDEVDDEIHCLFSTFSH